MIDFAQESTLTEGEVLGFRRMETGNYLQKGKRRSGI